MDGIVQRRNMFVQVLLFIITCGIYGIYWFYVTASEMKTITHDDEASPGLWTFLLIVPIANLYAHYKYCELFEDASEDEFNRWLLFVIGLVFAPAVWLIVQTELNRQAEPMMSTA